MSWDRFCKSLGLYCRNWTTVFHTIFPYLEFFHPFSLQFGLANSHPLDNSPYHMITTSWGRVKANTFFLQAVKPTSTPFWTAAQGASQGSITLLEESSICPQLYTLSQMPICCVTQEPSVGVLKVVEHAGVQVFWDGDCQGHNTWIIRIKIFHHGIKVIIQNNFVFICSDPYPTT